MRIAPAKAIGILCLLWPLLVHSQGQKDDGKLTLEQSRTYMVELINRDRQSQGVGPVTLDKTSSLAGEPHTDEMVEYGYLSHWGLDGKKPDQRYTEGGGTDADFENAHLDDHEQYSSDAVPTDDVLKRKLSHTQQPTFTRGELEEIESEFFNEKPPGDGHRTNILDPKRTRVGIALSTGSDGTITRVACTQEFINGYGSYSTIPRVLKRGQGFDVTGTLAPGLGIYEVLLRSEDLPHPMSVAELNQTTSYGPPGGKPLASYFSDSDAPIAVHDSAQGQNFSLHVSTLGSWPSGLYYLQIFASEPGKTPFLISDRTITMAENENSSTLGASPYAQKLSPNDTRPIASVTPLPVQSDQRVEWSDWVVNKRVPAISSRKGCVQTDAKNGLHSWLVEFRNDSATAYQIQFQLVPAHSGTPGDWPASAVTDIAPAAGTPGNRAIGGFSIAVDCGSETNLYSAITPAK